MQAGETFSSWLHRTALANAVADHTFSRLIFKDRVVWDRDIDRFADTQILLDAGEWTGESPLRLRQGLLACAEGRVFPKHTIRGHLRWVLPVAVRRRNWNSYGQQFCPACISEATPYFRLLWRFAWATVCTRHSVALRDSCPKCDVPVTPHRLRYDPRRGLTCGSCAARIAQATSSAVPAEVHLQTILEEAFTSGTVLWQGRETSADHVFTGLRSFASGLREEANGPGLVNLAPELHRKASRHLGVQAFERWRIHQRRFGMSVISATLLDWPDRFVSNALECGMYRSRFGEAETAPWLENALLRLERPVANLHAKPRQPKPPV
ncbi:MAG: TniQ family protein [Lysobacterales bacterium]